MKGGERFFKKGVNVNSFKNRCNSVAVGKCLLHRQKASISSSSVKGNCFVLREIVRC